MTLKCHERVTMGTVVLEAVLELGGRYAWASVCFDLHHFYIANESITK